MNSQVSRWTDGLKRIWRFARKILTRYSRERVSERAAQIAYYLLLSVFPFLILLINILGLIGRISVMDQALIGELSGLVPEAVLTLLTGIINGILKESSWTLLSFSFIGVIWAASNGTSVIIRSLERIYGLKQPSHFLKSRGKGLLLTLALSVAILLSMLLIGFGDTLLRQLAVLTNLPILTGAGLRMLRFLLSLLFLTLFFSGLYHFVSRNHARFSHAIPGAIFASVAWVLFAQIFSFYVQYINNFTRLYGSLGGMIMVMLWLYYDSVVILAGGIINVALEERRVARTAEA